MLGENRGKQMKPKGNEIVCFLKSICLYHFNFI